MEECGCPLLLTKWWQAPSLASTRAATKKVERPCPPFLPALASLATEPPGRRDPPQQNLPGSPLHPHPTETPNMLPALPAPLLFPLIPGKQLTHFLPCLGPPSFPHPRETHNPFPTLPGSPLFSSTQGKLLSVSTFFGTCCIL